MKRPDELDLAASKPIEFEFRMMTCQAREFLIDCPTEIFEFKNCRTDALLEAWLMHIRLLDEFFRTNRGIKNNEFMTADHWPLNSKPVGFLDQDNRNAVNRQLAHLKWERKRWEDDGMRPPWERNIRNWTSACCLELIRFIDSIPHERKSAFDGARTQAEKWLKSPESKPLLPET